MVATVSVVPLLLGLLLQPATALTAAPTSAPAPDELGSAVMQAAGSANWGSITRIKFTFNVARPDGKNLIRSHDWNIKAGTDTVTNQGKSTTVNLVGPHDDPEAKQAFAAWTNDSYWLIAPLKVMDNGVIRTTQPDETIDGQTYHVLHLSFQHVGLTPGDQYNLYVDRDSKLVRHWDHIPANGQPRRFTWDGYEEFSGIRISTKHLVNGKPAITFSDVSVTAD